MKSLKDILKRWNTLRNQILVVFLTVMVIVLAIVGAMTFSRVSMLLKNNAEEQIQQVAIESNGRFESLYEQINMVTKQVATNGDVQQVLLDQMNGKSPTFNQRQSLMETINTLQANADGIYSIELYTQDLEKVIPLGDESLTGRIHPQTLEKAKELKGSLLWIGEDDRDPNFFLAIRRVSLMDQAYINGGYLLVRVNETNFQLSNESQDIVNEYTILVDHNNKPIVTNYNRDIREVLSHKTGTLEIDGNDYMLIKQKSQLTGWTLVILTPVSTLTQGISVLRTGIIVSGLIGIVIFLVSSFFLSTLITNPIVKLTKTMRKASEGVLTSNPDIASTNEINELNNTYNQLVEETNHLIKMVYEKELTRSRTELKALQAQINPHFLFNTLDALYWSLEDKEEEELAEHVLAMSELFRYTITHISKSEWVSISEELEHIERYMQIMKMRFGERLTWSKAVSVQWEDVKIPKLLIQPLVENAILHGAGNTSHPCHVSVNVMKSIQEGMITIKVTDNGPGMKPEKIKSIYLSLQEGGVTSIKGKGIAISNVQKRLHLYYQNEHLEGIKIESEKDKGTSISFDIPLNGGKE
ncbi:sensor histidine kinase [Aquibacillus koreensis]|uniref:histidine kinase n=1 Tax=Aquibacillus koreensis TaxID=279446 RepID=A0A9X3WRY4_9BACI|nr:sensor histidine kinase [Aquibacillus koreensis]MCT2537037.1 sensor histidine kinase [Aquibacillus koreensis]MDC3422309.1 sensor histidine kinase [Aquibacillus koreensis]